MKKYLIVFVAVMLLVVTGCGNTKTLSCSLEEDGQKAVVDMEFGDNDVLTKMTMTMSVALEEELTDDEKAMMESYMELMCDAYDYEGIDCKVDTGSKSVDVVITMNLDKMSAEDKTEMGYSDAEATYDAMKKAAEEDGYTCK